MGVLATGCSRTLSTEVCIGRAVSGSEFILGVLFCSEPPVRLARDIGRFGIACSLLTIWPLLEFEGIELDVRSLKRSLRESRLPLLFESSLGTLFFCLATLMWRKASTGSLNLYFDFEPKTPAHSDESI